MIYNFDSLSFQILTIDRFYHKAGSFNVNARPYAALSLRVNGEGDFEIGEKRYTTTPGDVIFLPADTPYKVEYSVSESIVIHFEHCNYLNVEIFRFNHKMRIEALFHKLLELWDQNHSVNQAKSIIYDIFENMSNDQKQSIKESAITNCIQFMEANFTDSKVNVKTICKHSFITASTLQRGFMKHFGMSPKQYLTHLRMNRALELLSENELSIKEISVACGFIDEKYFSRAFKKKYNCSPSQFRKSIITL